VNAVIVGAALVRDGKLLAQQRAWPPKHAGQWELPGGRVEEGESEAFAPLRHIINLLPNSLRRVAVHDVCVAP